MLLEWEASGDIPDDLQVVGVSTAVSADAPELPARPVAGRDGLDWPVIADDDGADCRAGLRRRPGFPFIVVRRRRRATSSPATSGELPIDAAPGSWPTPTVAATSA